METLILESTKEKVLVLRNKYIRGRKYCECLLPKRRVQTIKRENLKEYEVNKLSSLEILKRVGG